jgi:hypothetical protein
MDINPLIGELEYKVWVAVDEMISLLGQVSGLRVPVPSQLLGLLPTKMPQIIDDWPDGFQLDSYASQLEVADAEIGTFTKSPFVRVSHCETYPALRRASRLSYTIWILLDALTGADAPTKQDLLEMTSVADRLSAAYQQLETINTFLRNSR